MMDLKLKDGDLSITRGDLAMCNTDIDSIAQTIAVRLKTLAGEWFLDTDLGIPYLTAVLGKKRDDRFLKKLIIDEIQGVSGVSELSDFSFDDDALTRTITIRFKAKLFDQRAIHINETMGV